MRRNLSKVMVLAATVVLGAYLALPSLSANASQGKDKNARGRQLYAQYCASCHGADAKGNGPVATALKTQPTDLTTISSRAGGKFPDLKVRRVISGDDFVAGHGTREMPVWGQYFTRKQNSAAVSTGNVYALTMYVSSIQGK